MTTPSAICRLVAFALTVLALPLLCGSCRVTAEAAPTFDLADVTSYRWAAEPRIIAQQMTAEDDFARSQAVEIIDRRFRELGLKKVGEEDPASVAVEALLHIEVKTQQNDPNFSVYVAQRYEEGTFELRLFDGETDEWLWSGECRHRLRDTANVLDGYKPEQLPIKEPRVWPIEAMVDKVMKRLKKSR